MIKCGNNTDKQSNLGHYNQSVNYGEIAIFPHRLCNLFSCENKDKIEGFGVDYGFVMERGKVYTFVKKYYD